MPEIESDWHKRFRAAKMHVHRYYIFYTISAPIVVWLTSNYFVRGGANSEKVINSQSLYSWKRECEKGGKAKIEKLNLDLKTEMQKNVPLRDTVVSLYPLNHQQSNVASFSMTKEEQVKFLEELFPDLVQKFKSQRGIL
ncbi:predicted protein [Naegleria gruberi]|uniref:Predicted protein n=1 Tax=Naegleria gruberi TaxID=5762 RepID=D2UYJ5_NAEGR|nr:uncharacterized protein NAEGRDRAFT_61490 [Naegleria gruberi]EFC50804.1 predicted protein [Naegleria gruberi]|eukprot:XP_002683548.1 predicted protein [Naegleria gruberi strain NEG-M]